MGADFRLVDPLRRLTATVTTLILLAGVFVVALVASTGVSQAADCPAIGNSQAGGGSSSHSVSATCGGNSGSQGSISGSRAQVNLDPNREVCFYRPSRGGVYATADPPPGQAAADGRSMDRFCGKASEIAAMQAAGYPLDACSGPCGGQFGLWVDNATPPTPQEIAIALLATLDLSAPAAIHTSPDADKHLVVGVPTWFWIDGSDEPETASDGPIAISARPTVKWKTSQGPVNCTGPGTPYEHGKSDPNSASPDCGWTFTSAGAHTVTVMVTWTITVTGAPGVTFPPDVFTVTRPVQVDEVQTVNR